MAVPPEYHGREQSFLKHRVLQQYLRRWGKKLGSLSRKRPVRLWYVDCFAGPWKSKSASLEDTSIDIGLRALEEAATTWRSAGNHIEVNAVFVESRRKAFLALRTHLEQRGGSVLTHPLHGKFGDHVDTISRWLGNDPAFIFVDPTGFKGVAMSFIRPLVRCSVRDVMINVMFNDINRWKDDPRSFLRAQMRDFFGLEDDDLVPGLSESDLFSLYRQNLKQRCGLRFAADLAVPHPTQERTWFHLVVGGSHREVLRVFREVEESVVGREAAQVRDEASKRLHEQRTGQTALLFDTSAPVEPRFETRYGLDAARVSADLVETLGARPVRFADLWPALLETHHVTRAKVARLALQAESQGQIEIVRADGSTRRTLPKNPDLLRRLDPGDPVAGSSAS